MSIFFLPIDDHSTIHLIKEVMKNGMISPGFFVLRTPTLPWDHIEKWCDGLVAARTFEEGGSLESSLRMDKILLRNRLRKIIRRPEVWGALYLASPSLIARSHRWLEGDDSEEAVRVEPAIVRYFMRMAGRATPFGLFAGTSVGVVRDFTRLHVPTLATHVRHTRLDMDVVLNLTERLSKRAELCEELRWCPPILAYGSSGRLRYYESRSSNRSRVYRVVDVDRTPYLDAALDFVRRKGAATMREIAEEIANAFEDIDLTDAYDYVHKLVDAQLLDTTLSPVVTGEDPLLCLIRELRRSHGGKSVASKLEKLREDIVRIDSTGFDVPIVKYREIAETLCSLSVEVDLTRLFRVNLYKPTDCLALGASVVNEISKGMNLLAAITPPSLCESALDRFIRRFELRYQGREVPLLEALDEESGIGFDVRFGPGSRTSSLLDGIGFQKRSPQTVEWSQREECLLRKHSDSLRKRPSEITLNDVDIKALSPKRLPQFPPGLAIMVSIAASSEVALQRGDYRIYMQRAFGPTSGKLFGRFCDEDAELVGHVQAALKLEEACDPDAIHAEIAYLPLGRSGNVVSRPVLRNFEIPVLARSGASKYRQIFLDDLFVSIRYGKVQLRSGRLGRRVVPHLTCAHVFSKDGLSIYRFLGSLAEQGFASEFGFSWGPIGAAPFLPRVVYGKFVLSLARWNIPGKSLRDIDVLPDDACFSAIQELRAKLGLPRFIWLVDADNTLPIDLGNVLSIRSFTNVAKHFSTVALSEMFPPPDELLAHGETGRFHHELIVPFVRQVTTSVLSHKTKTMPMCPARPNRAKRPGEEWLFAKMYCGTASLDRILSDFIRSFVRELRMKKLVDRWFFVRHADPQWHLRLRLRGQPASLWNNVAPQLFAYTSAARDVIQKVVIDTYDPEEERYGGEEGLDVSEQIFEADSDAALSIVGDFRTDSEARWKLALLGMDALLEDLGFSIAEKRQVVYACRAEQISHYSSHDEMTFQIRSKYRTLRSEIETLLVSPPKEYGAGIEAIRFRSRSLLDLAARLLTLETCGRLLYPRTSIAGSYLHMWTNRILRDSMNAYELVLYDFLFRIYDSRIAKGS
jgi:class I lanthipeptide synthase